MRNPAMLRGCAGPFGAHGQQGHSLAQGDQRDGEVPPLPSPRRCAGGRITASGPFLKSPGSARMGLPILLGVLGMEGARLPTPTVRGLATLKMSSWGG